MAVESIPVLVCGTNYGRVYLEALSASRGLFELAGILALGSNRSLRLADRYKIPLFRKADQLPADIQIACVAVSGGSTPRLGRELLERGIHVLCEHPQKPEFLSTALELAGESDLCFHVNGHFGELPAAKAFCAECSHLYEISEPAFTDIVCSDRSLYSSMDILRQATGKLRSVKIGDVFRSGVLTVVTTNIDGVPINWNVQTSDGSSQILPDRSPEYLTDTRINMAFPSGTLGLMGISGPVLWNRHYNQAAPSEHLYRLIDETEAATAKSLWQARIEANLSALKKLRSSIENGSTPPEQTAAHILEVSRCWQIVGKELTSL